MRDESPSTTKEEKEVKSQLDQSNRHSRDSLSVKLTSRNMMRFENSIERSHGESSHYLIKSLLNKCASIQGQRDNNRYKYTPLPSVVGTGSFGAKPALKMSTVVRIENSKVESGILDTPPLEEVAGILNKKLKNNFEEVEVEVTDCPDLTQPPFTLACKGLTGNASIVEVGGVPYLLPKPKKEKLYDLRDIGKVTDLDPCYIIGAGAGPWPYIGTNCEMMINMEIQGKKVRNKTRIAKVDTTTGSCQQEVLPDSECRSAVLSNLYCSLGQNGKVLKISCCKRIGSNDFVTSIRKSLAEYYKEQYIGLGGVFLIKKGKVKQHVMPDFSNKAINSDTELNNWLKFYEMNTPLIAVGTLVNQDLGLDLRLQHFHSFSHHGEGGHYHIDTTPNDVEYLAYFGMGEKIYRIDRPKETHSYGRD